MTRTELQEKIAETAKATSFTYSGFIEGVGDSLSYTFTRYPRRAFGPVPPIERFETAARALLEGLTQSPATIVEWPPQLPPAAPEFRVVFGLREGYGADAKTHQIEEVRRALGERFDVQPAEIFSAGGWGTYSEPAAIIRGPRALETLRAVFDLAEGMNQARIAVESLDEKKSWMVETKHCKDPDAQ
jgi:hypothetical protein